MWKYSFVIVMSVLFCGCVEPDLHIFPVVLESGTIRFRTQRGDSVIHYCRATFPSDSSSSTLSGVHVSLNGMELPFIAQGGYFERDSFPPSVTRDWVVTPTARIAGHSSSLNSIEPFSDCSVHFGDTIHVGDTVRWYPGHRPGDDVRIISFQNATPTEHSLKLIDSISIFAYPDVGSTTLGPFDTLPPGNCISFARFNQTTSEYNSDPYTQTAYHISDLTEIQVPAFVAKRR